MKSIALSLTLILGVGLVGCSFSQQARQQRAYQKYVRKSSSARQKQRMKFHSDKPQMPVSPMPSQPMESIATGPEAMPSEASR